MTKAEVQKLWEAGHQVALVEFRSSRVDELAWRDKTTGKAMKAKLLRHTVEAGTQSVSVQERMPDDWDGKVPFEFTKGEQCALNFSAWMTERGAVTVRGTLQRLQPEARKVV